MVVKEPQAWKAHTKKRLAKDLKLLATVSYLRVLLSIKRLKKSL